MAAAARVTAAAAAIPMTTTQNLFLDSAQQALALQAYAAANSGEAAKDSGSRNLVELQQAQTQFFMQHMQKRGIVVSAGRESMAWR